MVQDCWDFKNCQVKEECPAYPKFGKMCFSIEGTLCGGEIQGEYSEKIERCRQCDYYDKVIRQAS